MTTLIISLHLMATAILLYLLGKQTRRIPFLNPVTIVVLFYIVIAISGYLSYSTYLSSDSGDGASISLYISPIELTKTLSYFLSIINATLLGSVSFNLVRSIIAYSITKQAPAITMPIRQGKAQKNRFKLILTLALVPQALLIIGVGPDNIINATDYLSTQISILRSAGNMLILPSAILLGYGYSLAISQKERRSLIFTAVTAIILQFSLATRSIAFIIPLFTIGFSMNNQLNGNNKTKTSVILSVLSVVTFFPLLYIPLFLRGLDSHGLIPYVNGLSMIQPEGYLLLLQIVLNNLLISFPLTSEIMTGSSNSYPIEYLLTAINPLPGMFTNWNNISPELRLNPATPYNTLGEIYLYGKSIALSFFFCIGIALMHISRGFYANLKNGRVFFSIIALGLCFGFAIISAQYNLRSSVRFIYYALFINYISNINPRNCLIFLKKSIK